jgi:hypothetical protein
MMKRRAATEIRPHAGVRFLSSVAASWAAKREAAGGDAATARTLEARGEGCD